MEWLKNRTPDSYMYAAVFAFALLALFNGPFQRMAKMAVWTVIILGALTQIAWPALRDNLAKAVILSIYGIHFLFMYVAYPYLPSDGYLSIGIAIVAEILVFSIPVGWLMVRYRRATPSLDT